MMFIDYKYLITGVGLWHGGRVVERVVVREEVVSMEAFVYAVENWL